MNPHAITGFRGATRRDFVKTSALAATAAATLPMGSLAETLRSTKSKLPEAETLVTTLYRSLSDAQRSEVCFDFNDERRFDIDNNWFIVKERRVDNFYSKDQQAMIREIFMKMHSEEYADKVMHQVEDDAGRRGFGECSVALFGEPETGQFEFVITGRHVTRRCDGDSVAGTAFGGPIFYGHAGESFDEEPHHPGNVYWFQAQRANELYQMLDGKQREQALLDQSRRERGKQTVALTGRREGLAGIPMEALTADQKDEARKVLDDLLLPFRAVDREESLRLIEKSGFDHLHLSFYKGHDIGNDGIWDVFQIEGPNMIWYFRGDPHVHTWVHIKDGATASAVR